MRTIIFLLIAFITISKVEAQYIFNLTELQNIAEHKSLGYINSYLIGKRYKYYDKQDVNKQIGHTYMSINENGENYAVEVWFGKKQKSVRLRFIFFEERILRELIAELVKRKFENWTTENSTPNDITFIDKRGYWLVGVTKDIYTDDKTKLPKAVYTCHVCLMDEIETE